MNNSFRLHPFGVLFLLLLSLIGCGPVAQLEDTTTTAVADPESAFCSTVRTFSTSTEVTAQAQFYARQVKKTLVQQGLYGPLPAQDIKFAEVAVVNSDGTEIQCGTTDATGNISVQIPKVAGSYRLYVRSRADSSTYKASVLNTPAANRPYYIYANFSLAGSETTKAVTLPIADYRNTLEGGAFNILNQVYRVNEYLRSNSACAICTTFTVAPKVAIYWKPGITPLTYFGDDEESLSFYLNADAYGIKKGIYIQGGIKGDVNCSDTDHFDNSVIIHEYGHFLENTYSKSDSPGGSHNGNFVIDPRLAWSEGFANFFQGAVAGTDYYRDTNGNEDCSGSNFLRVDLNLEEPPGTTSQDYMAPGTGVGEGIFREVSVARLLYDLITSSVGGDGFGVSLDFSWIWHVFSDSSTGFAHSSVHYRNIGRFNEIMRPIVSARFPASLTNFDNAVSNEFQRSDRREYAYPVSAVGGTCTFLITGVTDPNCPGSSGSVCPNQFASSDFFQFYYNGSSSLAISVKYAPTGGGSPSDLDLYAYREGYTFGESSDLISSSARLYPEASGNGIETVSFSGRPAGYYMINVRVKGNRPKAETEYYLETNTGVRVCP